MLQIRPYKAEDARKILSWCHDEESFYKWSAGVLGAYPITEKEFAFVEGLMPFTACDGQETVGFFTLRKPAQTRNELRFGFVIVNPDRRGCGYGKAMLQLGIQYAFDVYGADLVSLGVFENNLPAYYCYRAAGFEDVTLETAETYRVLGQEWKCKELVLLKHGNIPL